MDIHSFLGCKHLRIEATNRAISGETAQYTKCVAFPFGILEGPIVLECFCWELTNFEPGSNRITVGDS
jgi:hypothetical protein